MQSELLTRRRRNFSADCLLPLTDSPTWPALQADKKQQNARHSQTCEALAQKQANLLVLSAACLAYDVPTPSLLKSSMCLSNWSARYCHGIALKHGNVSISFPESICFFRAAPFGCTAAHKSTVLSKAGHLQSRDTSAASALLLLPIWRRWTSSKAVFIHNISCRWSGPSPPVVPASTKLLTDMTTSPRPLWPAPSEGSAALSSRKILFPSSLALIIMEALLVDLLLCGHAKSRQIAAAKAIRKEAATLRDKQISRVRCRQILFVLPCACLDASGTTPTSRQPRCPLLHRRSTGRNLKQFRSDELLQPEVPSVRPQHAQAVPS